MRHSEEMFEARFVMLKASKVEYWRSFIRFEDKVVLHSKPSAA